VLAAYRIGDSPINAITPLNAYFALVVGFAQKYDKDAGVGTVVSLMLPYVVIMLVLWTILFAAWHLLGLPWGYDILAAQMVRRCNRQRRMYRAAVWRPAD
jgi:aminobenzoyl-glutamate transport protein